MSNAFPDDPILWFRNFSGHLPYPWQQGLLLEDAPRDRLIRVPTGFGKTLGVIAPWAWHRAVRRDPAWPRRFLFCLPMRVLVEQTIASAREALGRVGLLREGPEGPGVHVHALMGGEDPGEWHLYPEGDALLVGTQDMLLSRALNRGWAAPRARWPMEFGLLHTDCLWLLDEVQLMDVGLATSAQLAAFRRARALGAPRPAPTWWMSATLQEGWLRSVDTEDMVASLPRLSIPDAARTGHLWDDVRKPRERVEVSARKADLARDMADEVLRRLPAAGPTLTLVVVNTVERAVLLFERLQRELAGRSPTVDLRLVHSRFRPAERAAWREAFLRRDAVLPEGGRVVVATQVVEAGVDLDAHLLVTELAPWPALVQRFGRCARGGGEARVLVLDPRFTADKEAAPYAVGELDVAREALALLPDVSPLALERFEERAEPGFLARLYPYAPTHLLLERELADLFDTTPDLTGADLDVSRFIRSGDERDCQVAWLEVPPGAVPSPDWQPPRDALCAVPFLQARNWLCADKSEGLRRKGRAWVWDWIDGVWRVARRAELLPGRSVVVAAEVGGYDPLRGFDPTSRAPVTSVPGATAAHDALADHSQDGETSRLLRYKTIASHARETVDEARRVADALALEARHRRVLELAALWHDVGKAHAAFQGSIRAPDRPRRQDLAKAPPDAWPREHLYRQVEDGDRRAGFRHELASLLALFAILETPPSEIPSPEEAEILGLDASDLDLVAWLVASHHGKVRTSLHAAPADQDYVDRDGRGPPIRGVREGDPLPAVRLGPGEAEPGPRRLTLEPASLGLSPRTGRSWTERVQRLLDAEGPFTLAWLEALLRAADVRASRLATGDPLLTDREAE